MPVITNKPLLIKGLAFHLGLPEEVIEKGLSRMDEAHYGILESDNRIDLEEQVTNFIRMGWKLAGGVSVMYSDHAHFFQAVVRED